MRRCPWQTGSHPERDRAPPPGSLPRASSVLWLAALAGPARALQRPRRPGHEGQRAGGPDLGADRAALRSRLPTPSTLRRRTPCSRPSRLVRGPRSGVGLTTRGPWRPRGAVGVRPCEASRAEGPSRPGRPPVKATVPGPGGRSLQIPPSQTCGDAASCPLGWLGRLQTEATESERRGRRDRSEPPSSVAGAGNAAETPREQWFLCRPGIVADPGAPGPGARPRGLERAFGHRLGRGHPPRATPAPAPRPSAVGGRLRSVHPGYAARGGGSDARPRVQAHEAPSSVVPSVRRVQTGTPRRWAPASGWGGAGVAAQGAGVSFWGKECPGTDGGGGCTRRRRVAHRNG